MGILRLLYKEHVQEHAQGSAIGGNRAAVRVSNRSGMTDASQCAVGRRRSRRGVRSMRMAGIGTCVQGMIGKGKNAA